MSEIPDCALALAHADLRGSEAHWGRRPMAVAGPVDGMSFLADVRQGLVPTLRTGDSVILVNLGCHKGGATGAAGAGRRFRRPTALASIRSSGVAKHRASSRGRRPCPRRPPERRRHDARSLSLANAAAAVLRPAASPRDETLC
ncbi:hypothetical protein LNKW23_13280 [Paralimibaculum aggregatum]|uniref:Uncharacterized protein n=1 Tax=Paralimibaculum aggregatum TaxID=3036245 RepID=A0ABQ6LIQ5_9RHOB|nr:hypothetical protein LNKW23_13280 [Limibaculum sp. NKW23]